MKIAYVLNTYPQPSHSFIRRELQALERQGLQVHRFAMRGAEGDLVDPQDRAEAERTEYVLAKGLGRLLQSALGAAVSGPGHFLSALKQALRMGRQSEVGTLRHLIYLLEATYVAQRCRALGVEHVHAHFGTNAAAVAALCRTLGGPRYSFTVHGPEEFDAPRALSLPEKLTKSAFAIAVSNFGRSQLSRWAPFAVWPRLNVVHCGIEKSKFPSPVPMPSGPLRLVAVGRFVEQKGQMVLVNALAMLRDLDVHLTLVGDGEMRPDLEAAVATNGLQDKVSFTGWLSEADVTRTLTEAHVLAMPSFAEGLPMVVMEAMAAARPVIATYIAGTPELVQSGRTGWLIPAGDAEALADAIRHAAALPTEELAQMGLVGRARVFERHDVETEAAKLSTLFKQAGD